MAMPPERMCPGLDSGAAEQSVDCNPVEHDFANLKRLWSYNADKPLEDSINMYT